MRRASLNLDLLRIFSEVAQLKYVNKAAQKLGMTPPAVSQSLVKLENQLGVELFMHDVRPLRLTPIGQQLLNEGLGLLRTADTLYDRYSSGNFESTHLRLGFAEQLTVPVAPWLIKSLKSSVGDILIESGAVNPLIQKMKNQELDVLVGPNGLLREDRWARVAVCEENFVLVTGKGVGFTDSLGGLQAMSQNCPLIQYTSENASEVDLERIIKALDLHPMQRIAVNSTYSLLGLVANLDGWTIIPATNLWCAAPFKDKLSFGELPGGRQVCRTIWAIGDKLLYARRTLEAGKLAREAVRKEIIPQVTLLAPEIAQSIRVLQD
jgi:DNA-binding transcriptional LysR family regulator